MSRLARVPEPNPAAGPQLAPRASHAAWGRPSRALAGLARALGFSGALLVAVPASAVVQNSVFVTNPGVGDGTKRELGTGQVSVTSNYGRAPVGENPGASVNNRAVASAGSVGAFSESAGSVASGTATATTTGTFTIIGPGSSVAGSLNLSLAGQLGVEGGQRSPSAGAGATLHFAFGPGSGTYRATLSKGANLAPPVYTLFGGAGPNPFEPDPVTGATAWNSVYTTPTVALPVGQALSFQLQITATTSLGSGVSDPAAFGGASSQFGNTVTLATNGAVFNLPEGYTVESSDLRIFNNRFVPLPIPEPSTYAMLCAGLALLGWQVRRRKV